MSARSLLRAAVRNNAEWCDVFCCTHGISGEFRSDCWLSPMRTPAHYPDAVTLLPGVAVEQVLSSIDASDGCSVKDSFACLELAAAGFQPLLMAEWLVREPAGAPAGSDGGWSAVTTEEELEEWEAGWAAPDAPRRSSFFRPELLSRHGVCLLAGYAGDRIVAGAVTSRSPAVVGLSNVFDNSGDPESAWAAAAAAATARWGDLPIVGYDSGGSLEAAHHSGFTSVGELIVWSKGSLSAEE